MLRVITAGSRNYNNYEEFKNYMIKLLFELNKKYPSHNILFINRDKNIFKINPLGVEIISGMATGADTLGVRFAKDYNLKLKEFPAEWENLDIFPCRVMINSNGSYNALAGHNRNKKMAEYASIDNFGVLVLFWDGKSNGSKNMKNQAMAYGIDIYEYAINKQK